MEPQTKGPGQVYFFCPRYRKNDWESLMGINEQGHLFLPPPGGMEHLNLSMGPAGFCPRINYRGHVFVRADWIMKTFPSTIEDIRHTQKEVFKLFRKFKKTEKA